MKTGRLESRGRRKLGVREEYEYFQCVDCLCEYPRFTLDDLYRLRREGGPGIYCNGKRIESCPFCTPAAPRPSDQPAEEVCRDQR